MKLSILIATVIDRRAMFEILYKEFLKQIDYNDYHDKVEVIYNEDNKEISVGRKRQLLLEEAKGEYIVFFDSDDFPSENYVRDIVVALETKIVYSENGKSKLGYADCVGFLIKMTTDGKNEQTCCHSLKYPIWDSGVDGYDYVRNVTHFNPVRRELALQVGFQDKRYGEDKEYSDKVTTLCKTEIFLHKYLFNYRYTTSQPFNQKYGIA